LCRQESGGASILKPNKIQGTGRKKEISQQQRDYKPIATLTKVEGFVMYQHVVKRKQKNLLSKPQRSDANVSGCRKGKSSEWVVQGSNKVPIRSASIQCGQANSIETLKRKTRPNLGRRPTPKKGSTVFGARRAVQGDRGLDKH